MRLAQTYMDREGSITGLLQAVSEAIQLSGLIRRRAEENGQGEAPSPGTRMIP